MQLDTLWRGIEDFDSIRQLLHAGRNQLLDEIGLDWWDLVSVLIYPELQDAVLLSRLAEQFDATAGAVRNAAGVAREWSWPLAAASAAHVP